MYFITLALVKFGICSIIYTQHLHLYSYSHIYTYTGIHTGNVGIWIP